MMNVGSWLNFIAAAGAVYFGLIYLFLPKFTKYHKAALQKEWHELDKEIRTLILALMRATGGGILATAAGIIMLQLGFIHTGHAIFPWAILVIGSLMLSGSLYAMLMVRAITKGRPPIIRALAIFILLLAGFLFNLLA